MFPKRGKCKRDKKPNGLMQRQSDRDANATIEKNEKQNARPREASRGSAHYGHPILRPSILCSLLSKNQPASQIIGRAGRGPREESNKTLVSRGEMKPRPPSAPRGKRTRHAKQKSRNAEMMLAQPQHVQKVSHSQAETEAECAPGLSGGAGRRLSY